MKRGGFISITLLLLVLSSLILTGTALAQGPGITITSPSEGDTIPLTFPVGVTGLTSNPPAGAQVVITLFSGPNSVGTQTVPLTSGSWSANVPFSPMPGEFTDGSIRAELLDGSFIVVASAQIFVTWGAGPPPPATATPTETFVPPSATPTATSTLVPPTATPTATNPVPGPVVTVNSPTNGQTFNPANPVPVSGSSNLLPAGSTIFVRIRTLGGTTLGEQGIVPDSFGNFSVNITVNPAGIVAGNQAQVIAFGINNGTTVATSNIVTITWQPGGNPTLTITSPTNGSTINTALGVVASGNHTNLPGGSLIRVRAYINNGATLVGEGTVAPASNGTWSTAIIFNSAIPNGAPGTISALVQLGSGIITVSNTVNVTWSNTTGQPLVIINNPLNNSLLPINSAFPVSGFAANIPGIITVRAVNALGGVLAQQTVAPDPSGSWFVYLAVNTIPGSRGGIIAFASNPGTGATIASSRVDVTYGAQCQIRTDWFIYIVRAGDTLNRIAARTGSTAADLAYANCIANADIVFVGQQLRVPREPIIQPTPTRVPPTQPPTTLAIRITTPQSLSSVDTSNAVIVGGSGNNLAGRDLTIRASDANGRLLAQSTTRADNNSNWQTALGGIVVTQPTQGTITAFIRSGSGVVLATTSIPVVFQPTGIVTPGDGGEVPQQNLVITTPTDGNSITEAGEALVVGTVSGYDGEIRVRALDPLGVVIDEQLANLTPLNDEGDFVWQASLEINAIAGTYGTIFAYAPLPFGLDPALSDAASVIYGNPTNDPFVTITNPIPYSVLDISQPVVVQGFGGRLFEGNVVVRILDDEGTVIVEQPTTIISPDAGTGGQGPWEITLDLSSVPFGTRGTVIAFSTSARDGSIVAFASTSVTLGSPNNTPNFVSIQAPLPGSLVRSGETLLIAGTADGSNGNRVRVQVLGEGGVVLIDEQRTITTLPNTPAGTWQLAVDLEDLTPSSVLTITAETISTSGESMATDAIGVQVVEPAPV